MEPFAILNQIRKDNAHVCGHASRPSPASATTPSGWIEDGIIYNDGDFDDSWDSVAEVKTARRIGRPPSRFDLPEDSDEVNRPDNTTILGAVKVSGKTAGRTAFGLLNAVTGREEALIDQRIINAETGLADTVRRAVEIEPPTNYFIGRVQQDLLTNSTAGAQLTAVNGRGFDPAYVGAGDLHVKWWDNAYRLYSRLAVSRAGQEEERDTGWEGALYFQKTGGAFGGQAYVDAQSPDFEANDLGFMQRNDRIQAGTHIRCILQCIAQPVYNLAAGLTHALLHRMLSTIHLKGEPLAYSKQPTSRPK